MKKLLLTLAFAALAVVGSQAQGTIQFQNTALTRMLLRASDSTATVQLPVAGTVVNGAAMPAISYGVFVNGSQTPIASLGANSTSVGIITVPLGTAFPIPGVDAGQTASIQIRGWNSTYGADWRAAQAAFNAGTVGTIFGESTVGNFVLGPSSGPGVVIWSGSDTTKLRPMTLVQIVPEPSTIALGVLGLGSLLLFRRRK
jgi:hypothetical protein